MPPKRGAYRSGRNNNSRTHHHQLDENWSVRPLFDRHHEASSSAAEPSSSNLPQKAPQNQGGFSWLPKNRGEESPIDEGDSSSISPICGKEEASAGGSGSKLELDSNCDGVDGRGEASAELNLASDNQGAEGDDEIVKRLQELTLCAEEPELSEELLSINKQLQEDELLAVESIYGHNVFILENQRGMKCFQAHIHVEVPKGLHVTAKFNSSTSHQNRDGDSSDFSYSFKVEYLPPIILTCLLPKSYPSNCPPHFTISVQWLGLAKISDLCCKLDSIWLEQAGLEVIYRWLEWLHGCTLSYLGFDDEIVLGPYGVRNNGDRRAISGITSPDIDIPTIKSYNDEERHENFSKNIQECSICLSEFAGSEFIRLPCQHFFCGKCLKIFSDMHITEGTVLKLQCPEAKCGGMIPPGLLKRLLGEEEFEHWESLMLEKTLESMTDVFYCPRCETPCLEDKDDHAQCSKCYYSFCTLCRERRHVGIACMTPEMKLAILQERQTSTSMKGEQRRREADMINQILSMKEINRFAKQCPSCKMAISRSEGCNKMVCDNCGQYFCYRCNEAISGYEHFRTGNCELFPAEEIQRWEGQMNGRQIVGQIQAEMFANQGHPCPNCGQQNVKVGNNNHIFCWACQNHYCYLCKKMVRRSSQHYGPKGWSTTSVEFFEQISTTDENKLNTREHRLLV
ncbi:NDR1/HIN1-like 8, partial [Perilla frutescens var. hirtella]